MNVEGLKKIIKDGKVIFGSRSAVRALLDGSAKIVIRAANCPSEVVEKVDYYAELAKVPVVDYDGNALDLGKICGRPHSVALLTVTDLGGHSIAELKGD